MKTKTLNKNLTVIILAILIAIITVFMVFAPKIATAKADSLTADNFQKSASRAVTGETISYANGVFTYTSPYNLSGYLCNAYIKQGHFTTEEEIMNGNSPKEVYDDDLLQKSFTFTLAFTEGQEYSVVVKNQVWGVDPPVYTNILYVGKPSMPLPPAPVKEGHTFVGWYFDKALTQPYDGSPIYADTVLYAKFSINTYTVTFDSNGGTAVSTKTVQYNNSIITETPTRVGYIFKGWLLSDGTKYDVQLIKGDITLVAEWEAIIYTVTFYIDDTVYITLEIPYGVSLAEVMAQQNLQNYNIRKFDSSNGSIGNDSNDLSVMGDMNVTLEEKTPIQKVSVSWQKVLLGSALGIAVIALLCSIPSMLKKKKHNFKA